MPLDMRCFRFSVLFVCFLQAVQSDSEEADHAEGAG